MAKQSLITLKAWFKKGLKPLESQFADWLDSFWHKDTAIPISSVQNLQTLLNDLAPSSAINSLRNELRDGVPVGGDTLNKLYNLVQNIVGLAAPEAFSAASGIFPTTYGGLAVKAGSPYRISVAGTLGASNQKTVNPEDLLIALINNPTNNGNDWQVVESNRDLATSTILGLVKLAQVIIGAGNADEVLSTAGLKTLLDLKATLASPTFSGVPTAPTAVLGTNTIQIATTAFVKAALDSLIASAPGALDTLNELAAALGNDANFATTVTNSLSLKANKTDLPYGTAVGTNTCTVALSPTIPSLVAGQKMWVKFPNTNTGPVTLNPDSQGAKSIKKNSIDNLGVGDIVGGAIVELIYDGTNLQAIGLTKVLENAVGSLQQDLITLSIYKESNFATP